MTTFEATGDQAGEPPADDAPLMTHAYDGIREYDNPLPSWWRIVFVGTIVFAGFYGLYFHVVGWGHTPDQTYQQDLAHWESNREVRERAELANISETGLAQKMTDDKVLDQGHAVFSRICASCHGAQGAGLIGPNLTDSNQKYGSTRMDIYMTVRKGVPGTAMPPWGEQMAPADVVAAAVYVMTLRGQNLPGKPPEGAPVGAFQP